jgi:hypothetical protein
VFDVIPGGLSRDHQPIGDLLVREAARHQPEHVHLARGQAGRPGSSLPHAVAGRA